MSKNSTESPLPDRENITTKQSWGSFKIEKNKQHLSPSVSEFLKNFKKSDEISLKINANKKKKRKRIQSEINDTNSTVKVKKTKKNHIKKVSRLVFDDSLNESLSENASNDGLTTNKQDNVINTIKDKKIKKQKHKSASMDPQEPSKGNENDIKHQDIKKSNLKRFGKKNDSDSVNAFFSEGGLNDASMSNKPNIVTTLNENTEKDQKIKKQKHKSESDIQELSKENQKSLKHQEIKKNKLKGFLKKNDSDSVNGSFSEGASNVVSMYNKPNVACLNQNTEKHQKIKKTKQKSESMDPQELSKRHQKSIKHQEIKKRNLKGFLKENDSDSVNNKGALNVHVQKDQKIKKQKHKSLSLDPQESDEGNQNSINHQEIKKNQEKHYLKRSLNPQELREGNQQSIKCQEIKKNNLKRFIKKKVKDEKEKALAAKEDKLKTLGKKDENIKKKNKNRVNIAIQTILASYVHGTLDKNTLYNVDALEETEDLYQSIESSYVSDSDIDELDTKIEGLKLQDIFQPANSVYLADAHPLNIPRKHFEFYENDLEPDSKIFEKESEYDKENFNVEENTEVTQSENHIENCTENLMNDETNDFETEVLENTENAFEELNITEETGYDLSERQQDVDSLEGSLNKLMLKNNELLVILNTFKKISFFGFFNLKVLQGQLEIFGTTLDSKSTEKKMYSNRGSALLFIQNISNSQETSFRDIKTLINPELLFEVDKSMLIPPTSAVFLCKKLEEPFIKFIEQHISQVVFPTVDNDGPRVEFEPRGAWNYLQTDKYWTNITKDISRASKIAICGGKGVGKSTFLRYCINKFVQRFGKVRVVDLDPGQSEFTVPGCISIVEVTGEIFGSNFTHHLPFERSLLCNINVGYDIYKYLNSVETLLGLLPGPDPAFFNNFPTLYNLCGYHKGLGLDLTMQVLNLIKPTTLVQINSKNRNKNYLFDLSPVNVKLNLKNCDLELDYEFFALDSLAETQKSRCWNMEARVSRDINILAYLGRLMSDNVSSLTSHLIDAYSINLSSLKIKDSEGNTISPLAINANFVALCSVFENTYEFLVHGWGFVRGIDIKNDILVLITPENMVDDLYQVNHIVLTSNSLVASLLMSPGEARGHIPYVAEGTRSTMGQFTRRSYLPPHKK